MNNQLKSKLNFSSIEIIESSQNKDMEDNFDDSNLEFKEEFIEEMEEMKKETPIPIKNFNDLFDE